MLSTNPTPSSSSAIYRSEDEASSEDGEGPEDNPVSVIKRLLAVAPAAEDETEMEITANLVQQPVGNGTPSRDDISDFGDELAMRAAIMPPTPKPEHDLSSSSHAEPSVLITIEGVELDVPPIVAYPPPVPPGPSPIVYAQTPSRVVSLGTPFRLIPSAPVTPALPGGQPWASVERSAGAMPEPSFTAGSRISSHGAPSSVSRLPEEITLDEVAGLLNPALLVPDESAAKSDRVSDSTLEIQKETIDHTESGDDIDCDSGDDEYMDISASQKERSGSRGVSRSASAVSAGGILRSMKVLFPHEDGGDMTLEKRSPSHSMSTSRTVTPRSSNMVTVSDHPASGAVRSTSRPNSRTVAEFLVGSLPKFAPFPSEPIHFEGRDATPMQGRVEMGALNIGLPEDYVNIAIAPSARVNEGQISGNLFGSSAGSVRKAELVDDEWSEKQERMNGRDSKRRKVGEQSNDGEMEA
ncbi:hypothetical protein HDU93_000708 [Gonapodya sp. JEL0774]|nr:hypothetical protein HDU93_000708 [Gonapodya sp. JEL0774]